MDGLGLTIDGVPVSFSITWDHWQNVGSTPHAEFRVRIPKAYVNNVFHDLERAEGVSLIDSLMEEVDEYGSGSISIYMSRVASLLGQNTQERPIWVFAEFDAAIEDDEGVEFQGLVIPFDPERFLR